MKIKIGKDKEEKKTKKKKGKKTKLGKRLKTEVQKRKSMKRPTFSVPTSEEATKRREESSQSDVWKPREGLNKIIILPVMSEWGAKFPWLEERGHYPGGNDVLRILGIDTRPDDLPLVHGCPEFHEKRVCGYDEWRNKLRKSRSKKDQELARALFAGLRCHANIVDLREPKIVRHGVWGKTIRDDLLVALEDGNIFCDPDDLMIVHIRKTKTGKRDMDVQYHTTIPRMKKSVGPIRRIWEEGLHDLTQYLPPVPTPDEIEETIERLLAEAEAGEEEDGISQEDLNKAMEDDDDDLPDFN